MPNTAADKLIHVAVGAVISERRELLIARRPEHLHQGGLWEFPGGKVEPDEDVRAALIRELEEELALVASPEGLAPLTTVRHHYSDRSVLLDVWWVSTFSGEVEGREGQLWRWVDWRELPDYAFPEANGAIVEAIVGALR